MLLLAFDLKVYNKYWFSKWTYEIDVDVVRGKEFEPIFQKLLDNNGKKKITENVQSVALFLPLKTALVGGC